MQTIVLAAGQGTRMRPLTDRRPKPMLPVAGDPLVAHTAEAAVAAGASELVIVVGYEADEVRDYFGDEFAGVLVTFTEQPDQRGTADAVRVGALYLDDCPSPCSTGTPCTTTNRWRRCMTRHRPSDRTVSTTPAPTCPPH